jgi:hypothetical protein
MPRYVCMYIYTHTYTHTWTRILTLNTEKRQNHHDQVLAQYTKLRVQAEPLVLQACSQGEPYVTVHTLPDLGFALALSVYVCMYVCHTCMHVCMYVTVHTLPDRGFVLALSVYVCMYACMHVCMYVTAHALPDRGFALALRMCGPKADCVWVGRRRSRPKGNPRFEPFENCVFRVAQTWLNGIFPSPREFCGQLKRNQLYIQYTHTKTQTYKHVLTSKSVSTLISRLFCPIWNFLNNPRGVPITMENDLLCRYACNSRASSFAYTARAHWSNRFKGSILFNPLRVCTSVKYVCHWHAEYSNVLCGALCVCVCMCVCH